MADPDQDIHSLNSPGASFASTLQITIAVIVLNFILLLVILILYIRAKLLNQRATRSRHLVFMPYDSSTPRHALDTSVLNSLPVTLFQVEKDGSMECAVCITELKEGEEVRFLPNCKHGFHVECIDMWFHSNDTCPLCRDSVTRFEGSMEVEVEVKEFGTNLEEGSSSIRKRKEGMLVIDIPKPSTSFGFPSSRQGSLTSSKMPSESPLPSSRLLDEMKTPGSGRMKSFKRLVSRVSFKGVGSYYSSSSHYDIEQGTE